MPISSTSSGTRPAACAASVWNSAPASFARAPIAARSCTTPISLFTAMTETSRVGAAASAARSVPGSSEAVRPDRQHHRLEALGGQVANAFEDAFVLGGEGDDPPPLVALRRREARGALDGDVVRLRRAGGEDDLARLRADQRRHLPARRLHRLLGRPAHRVLDAVRVGEVLLPPGPHGGEHPRVERRGGVVVEVDGAVRTVHARQDGAASGGIGGCIGQRPAPDGAKSCAAGRVRTNPGLAGTGPTRLRRRTERNAGSDKSRSRRHAIGAVAAKDGAKGWFGQIPASPAPKRRGCGEGPSRERVRTNPRPARGGTAMTGLGMTERQPRAGHVVEMSGAAPGAIEAEAGRMKRTGYLLAKTWLVCQDNQPRTTVSAAHGT